MKIDILVINALLDSFMLVLSKMAGIELKTGLPTGEPEIKKDTLARGDVSSMMALNSKELDGSIAISFTKSIIVDLAQRILGSPVNELDEDETTLNLTGEITNMITGGTRKILSEHESDIDIAFPILLSGENHEINHHTDGITIILPFKLDAGQVFLEINFDRNTV